ncbi:DUF5658 family protein, partial [Chloroflexota bacterium]
YFFSNHMKYLLVVLVVLVVLDGFLTQGLINGGLARERNPFLAPLVGDIGFIILKAVGALVCAFILWDVYRRFSRVAVIVAWCCVVAYGVIVLWNSSLFFIA